MTHHISSRYLSSLPLLPPDPQQHLVAMARIVSLAFANGQYVDEISRQYIGNCHYDWNASRLIFDGERLVHHWGVWGYPMRMGSVQLQVAGVGAVYTHPEYRERGLMHRAALDSFTAMRQNNYDLSILRGRHYAKYGYVRAWNYVTYRLKPEQVPSLETKRPYQALGPEHMDEIINLYNKSYAGYTGTAVRPTYRMLQSGDMNAYGWFDAPGRLAGYVRAMPTDDGKALQCLEAAGDVEQGLAVVGEVFKAGGYEMLTFFTLPHAHPMLQTIRRKSCIVEDQYFYHTGWQVRIVNLHSALEKLLPLLERQLQRSHLADWRGALHLDAGEQSVNLQIEAGKVQIVAAASGEHSIHGGPKIARFLIGSDEPGEIIQQAGMACTGDAEELAAVLFPNRHPVMSHWDEY